MILIGRFTSIKTPTAPLPPPRYSGLTAGSPNHETAASVVHKKQVPCQPRKGEISGKVALKDTVV